MNARNTLVALCIAAGSLAAGATPAIAAVYVQIAPPAARVEVVPALQPGWVWQPGYWNWSGHHYVWVHGRRVHERHGSHWVAHNWHEEGGRWRMESGHWDRD